jgi:arylsulfatase A-like enzyme
MKRWDQLTDVQKKLFVHQVGVAQKPIERVSMVYPFDKSAAGFDAPSRRKTRYFEMMGVQGLYNDGWMLSAIPVRPPWELLGTAILDPASGYKFELYEVRKDWPQVTEKSTCRSGRAIHSEATAEDAAAG